MPSEQPTPSAPAPKDLAAAIRGETALARELDEHGRVRQHRDAARQRQRALPLAQRLARQVQRHQRGRARRVNRHRGTLQPEHVSHPPRRHAAPLPVEA